MGRKIDTVTVEVLRNLLMSISEETFGIIVRSAYSTNMKERRDVCTAVIDPDGNSVAQVESLAVLLGSMLGVVPNIYAKFGRENVKPGDMFIANDPYHGGGNHLPDIVIAAPAFAGEKLIGWIANIAHHSDIGGKVPGSTSGDADSLFQEGIRIPVIRIRRQGELDQSVMDLLLDNTRVPQEREGDLTAQISANLIGVERLQEAYARYGDTLIDCMKELVDYSERRVRAVVSSLPDGVYTYTDYVDGCGDKYPDPLPIHVSVTVKGDDLIFDFTGTAEQIKAPINVPYPCTQAAVFFAVKALMGDDIPANEGINRAVTLIAPKGCIVNPTEPSPVGAQIDCEQRIPDAIFGALAPIFPNAIVTAGNGACTTTILSGEGAIGTDSVFIFHEVIAGGGGASRNYDGLSGVQVNMTNTSNMPIEATEMEFTKILARKYELKADTGGAGEMRGGLGIERELEILQDNVLYTGLGDRHKFHPWGLEGGQPGGTGAFYRVAAEDGSVTRMGHKTTSLPLKKGDVIRVITPGAGGYGDPRKRPAEKVLKDVIEGKVSVEAARDQYGVVISRQGVEFQVDEAATAAARAE
ncbi:hydantoinase B/oxoprolinase family protein [Flavonifractor sp. An100]|uniref:hydantoinase B/oxoprolinase family protein n=1 Tax=Flavonifractor sp. An100 TaxID=1965538 RepID=UPI000B368CF0|nr:hydantoinase B/oxoprolinase family protein [Flavonifractor sp. An100]OUQ76729.1 hydantoinase [Flavonifractor sp. An100]